MYQPHEYPQRVLLCVTGMSPQIITETLYALAVNSEPRFIPTEIHLVTTLDGARLAKKQLIDHGHLAQLCVDYALDIEAIKFDDSCLHIISGPDHQALSDIRSEEHNICAANKIVEVVRELTSRADSDQQLAIHASIAGGRKTMGFFMGYAMSLFGRQQDRLSHVLISPADLEGHPEFFFPPKQATLLQRKARDGGIIEIDTASAVVSQAYIPFVRLRGNLVPNLLPENASYSEVVERAQEGVDNNIQIVLYPEKLTIAIGNKDIKMKPIAFGVYYWFAKRAKSGAPKVGWFEKDIHKEFLQHYKQVVNASDEGMYDKTADSLNKNRNAGLKEKNGSPKPEKIGFDKDNFSLYKKYANDALKKALGPTKAMPYLITQLETKANKYYQGLALTAEQIHFVE